MHFSAKRAIAIAIMSVCLSVTFLIPVCVFLCNSFVSLLFIFVVLLLGHFVSNKLHDDDDDDRNACTAYRLVTNLVT